MNWTLKTTTLSITALIIVVIVLSLSTGAFGVVANTASNLKGAIQVASQGAEGNGAEGNGPKKSGGAEGNGLERNADDDGAEGNGPARLRQSENIARAGVVAGVQEVLLAQKSGVFLDDFMNGESHLLVKSQPQNHQLLDVYFIYPDQETLTEGAEFVRIQGEVYYSEFNFSKAAGVGKINLPFLGQATLSFDKSQINKTQNKGQSNWHLAVTQKLSHQTRKSDYARSSHSHPYF